MDAVAAQPGRLSDKELACVLRGEPGYSGGAGFGQLAGYDFTAIRATIKALVSAGQLAYHGRTIIPARPAPAPDSPDAVDAVVMRCVTYLPFPVGRSGLAKILKGAAGSPLGPERCADHAALSHMTLAAIEATIERLVQSGSLHKTAGPRPILKLADRTTITPANMVQ